MSRRGSVDHQHRLRHNDDHDNRETKRRTADGTSIPPKAFLVRIPKHMESLLQLMNDYCKTGYSSIPTATTTTTTATTNETQEQRIHTLESCLRFFWNRTFGLPPPVDWAMYVQLMSDEHRETLYYMLFSRFATSATPRTTTTTTTTTPLRPSSSLSSSSPPSSSLTEPNTATHSTTTTTTTTETLGRTSLAIKYEASGKYVLTLKRFNDDGDTKAALQTDLVETPMPQPREIYQRISSTRLCTSSTSPSPVHGRKIASIDMVLCAVDATTEDDRRHDQSSSSSSLQEREPLVKSAHLMRMIESVLLFEPES